MKIDRLIGILSILLQKDQVTALFLAETFEVSRRTIFRDIENLSKAGIPITTRQGKDGGIAIMKEYRMDRTLLTSRDMQSIFAGLRSLDSVSATKRYQQLMEKLGIQDSDILPSNQPIWINLASSHKILLAPKIELIQTAIERCEKISFLYFAKKGTGFRMISPYQLIFHWSSWYVWGFCHKRNEFRMFKLSRITDLKNTGEIYRKQQMPLPDLSDQNIFPPSISAEILLDARNKWRLIEEYGAGSFKEREDGKLLFFHKFSDKDGMFQWILSMGTSVELLRPEEFRKEFQKILSEIQKKYEDL